MGIEQKLQDIINEISQLEPEKQIETINTLKLKLHEASPFKDEPVDCVLWVKAEKIQANDYNPNKVAPPEMELLKVSILSDGWIYVAKFPEKPYNHLYDIMNQAGLTPHQMRICQPYGDDQRRGLWLFHLIEPETWARIVARVNGANSGALYINDTGNINGYRKISKPPGHTYQSFAMLLLNSLPPKTKEHFENKIFLFVKWWKKRGYPDGIPDEADYSLEAAKLVPSWRRICKALLRNDYWCKGIVFSQHKSAAYQKYLELMRKRKKFNVMTLRELKENGDGETMLRYLPVNSPTIIS